MSATVSLLNACAGGTVCAFAVALIARSQSIGYRGLIRVILTRAVAVSALLICLSSSLEYASMPSATEAPATTVLIDALVLVDMLIFHAAALAVAHTAIRSIVLSLPVETLDRSLAAHVRTFFALLWVGELCCAVTVTALGTLEDSRLPTKWLVAYRATEIVAAACVMWYYIVRVRALRLQSHHAMRNVT